MRLLKRCDKAVLGCACTLWAFDNKHLLFSDVFSLLTRIVQVFNLCIEEDYDPSHFNGFVERYPFDDNHVPHLPLVKAFCESVQSWLSSDPKNIVVIHCMVKFVFSRYYRELLKCLIICLLKKTSFCKFNRRVKGGQA